MIQLSYWLFPAVFVAFLASSHLRPFLLPGLLAACAAGAANGAVAAKDLAAVGHGLAAALVLYLATRHRRSRPPEEAPPRALDVYEAVSAVVAWGALASLCCALISDDAWPYVLSRWQMMSIFGPFLIAGALVR